MAHIPLPDGLPGIIGPMAFRPETAKPLNELAEVLLRESHPDNTLTRGERELIAAHVSKLNDCHFCHTSHATFAALQLDEGWDTVDAVIMDLDGAPISDKLRALLRIAGAVQQSGLNVTTDMVEAARAAGATDVEIHDSVLIAAAFCMFNRYVDALGTTAPPDPASYVDIGADLGQHGYRMVEA